MQTKQSMRSRRIAVVGLLAAVIIVLQTLSTFIAKVSPVSISLVLVPIVLSAVFFDTKISTLLGFVFGAIVVFMCMIGADGGGYIIFSSNPWMTVLMCLLKGVMAGFMPGVLYRFIRISKNHIWPNVILPAIAAPVFNTGIFIAMMWFFYRPLLTQWAGETDLLLYIMTGLIGVNFLVELAINVILCPLIAGRIGTSKRMKSIYSHENAEPRTSIEE